MPKKPTGISEWAGAPPASEGGFAFAHGEFFAEATGQNRHRRATIPELKEQIASGTDKDHPAHWFEAQLLHYGLKPSKTKSVARMRLLDAVNGSDLAVPDHISKLEKKLRTAWTKSEREAKKKATTPAASKSTASSTTGGAKRKAEPEKSTPRKKPPASQPVTKAKPTAKPDEPAPNKPRAKQTARRGSTAASGPSRGSPSTTTSQASAMPRQTARRGGVAASGPSRSASLTTASQTSAMPRQTARRGGVAASGSSRSASITSTSQASTMPRQTARRSGSHATARNPPSQSEGFPSGGIEVSSDDDDDPPPPYSMVEDNELAPLGLLNGDYHIRSPDVSEQWPELGSEFDLTLTISGRQLWGRFDLGVIEGIMHFSERPWASSDEGVPFTWRGSENEGPIFYGSHNRGEIRFVGGGVVEGRFDYQGIEFHGRRIPDQGTRSSVSASNMEQEWGQYNEDRYEEENRARWR